MALGNDLREAREHAGISLSELAARTRIPLTTLRAIEQNEFSKVPPGIFVRSFIRTYAREVGIDPSAAIAEFRAITASDEEPAQESQEAAPVADGIRSRLFLDLSGPHHRWGFALIVAGLTIGVVAMNRNASSESADTGSVEAVATADSIPAGPIPPAPILATPIPAAPIAADPIPDSPVPAAPIPDAPPQQTPPLVPVATAGTGVQIELRTQGPCWVRAVVDGQVLFERLLQPGEAQSLVAQRDIILRVGDPAALTYSINGLAGEPLGAANMPVTVRFDSSGRASPVS